MVPYKKMDIIVEAFSKMPDKKLIVIGEGPERTKIKSLATKNIEVLEFVSYPELINYMQKAKAFIYAAEEDFGIVAVEAQACGTPVIAFGKGGALETVTENESGLFFYQQSAQAIKDAVINFEKTDFDYYKVRKNAEKFDQNIFEDTFRSFVDKKMENK
jgi:glycosyltransferase involved in cell wall biosynthesis